MELEAVPPVDGAGQRALIDALERAGARLDVVPAVYDSAWRAAGAREAVDADELEDYALSPRRTRGATRA